MFLTFTIAKIINSIVLLFGNYILLCTISKTIKGHMIMYPFIILYNSAMITFSQKVDL